MSKAKLGAVLGAVAAVVVWRLTALVLFWSEAEGTWPVIHALLALVGLTFLACGLLVFLKVPGKASLLFVAFCVCAGLHWGGPLELAPGELRTGLILFYLLVSGILAATVFLQLALGFPKRSPMADRPALVGLLYVPVGIAAMLAVISVASPSGSDVRATAQQGFLLVHTIVSNGFSFLALVLFATHLFRTGLSATQKRFVGLMLAGMLAAWLPYLVASAVGAENTDPWNLTVAALPVAFAIAFFGMRAAADPRQ